MKSFLEKLEPVDVVAVVVIVSAFAHLTRGGNGTTTAIVASIVFYYFGKKGRTPIK